MPTPKMPRRWLLISFIIISLLGFADATYLTAHHYAGVPVVCGKFGGCNTVLASEYATVAGVPVALFGAVFYLVVFLLTVAALEAKKISLFRFATWLTPLGFIASLWFIYLQFFVLEQICLYCMGSATTSTLLFVFGMIFLFKRP